MNAARLCGAQIAPVQLMHKGNEPVEVVCVEQGRRAAWAVMAHGRQAVVVTSLDAAVRIAQELREHAGPASDSASDRPEEFRGTRAD